MRERKSVAMPEKGVRLNDSGPRPTVAHAVCGSMIPGKCEKYVKKNGEGTGRNDLRDFAAR